MNTTRTLEDTRLWLSGKGSKAIDNSGVASSFPGGKYGVLLLIVVIVVIAYYKFSPEEKNTSDDEDDDDELFIDPLTGEVVDLQSTLGCHVVAVTPSMLESMR
uniref:Uncharacterized protein n=1 Tax=viral metagenome TaxID=1070528 RepID=A0A6C0BKW2_9ZZZZ